jgi:hypothetical protein
MVPGLDGAKGLLENHSDERELYGNQKRAALRTRLGQMFGEEVITPITWSSSNKWDKDYGIKVLYEHGDIDLRDGSKMIQCWCTTHILHRFVISRRDNKNVSATIGCVCFASFKGTPLYEEGMRQRTKVLMERKGARCTGCDKYFNDTPTRAGFCTRECRAIHEGRVCKECEAPLIKDTNLQKIHRVCSRKCQQTICSRLSAPVPTYTSRAHQVFHYPPKLANQEVVTCSGCPMRYTPAESHHVFCPTCYVVQCPSCARHSYRGLKCRKGKPGNVGRMFRSCSYPDCGAFEWI